MPAPPGAWRAIWLLTRLRLQRLLNVSGKGFSFKKGATSRAATPGKKRAPWLLGALLLLPMLFSSGNIARHNLLNMHCLLDQVAVCQAKGSMQAGERVLAPVIAHLMEQPFSTALAGALTLQLVLLWLVSLLLPLGMGELSKPDWDLEWLVTLPVDKATLLWARVLERTLVNPAGLLALWPSTTMIAWYSDQGWFSPLSGLVASLLLLATSPLMAAAGLLIWLEDRGPLLYSQRRSGLYGQSYRVRKLRSMRTDAERQGARWASRGDDRITHVGHWLRRLRLDELPQLLAVLSGEMSLIGPRPERPELEHELERQIPHYRIRHWLRPGLSGWAQVCYPYGASLEDSRMKLAYDLYYLRNANVLLDLLILFKTIRLVAGARGAVPLATAAALSSPDGRTPAGIASAPPPSTGVRATGPGRG